MQLRAEFLSGKSTDHLVMSGEFAGRLQEGAAVAFSELRSAAEKAGIDLCIASAFRDFDRQLSIWNAKARGERPVLGDAGDQLNVQELSDVQLMHAILRWSALPGASRHHWGTDMDVFDGACLREGETLQLTAAEYQPDGPFARLSNWLDQNLLSFGFARPYMRDQGGIAPEPWHISYQQLAKTFEPEVNLDFLAGLLADADIELKETILQNLEEIFERYIQIT